MKKLRAVQERVGTQTIPNDLRGVGSSPLLTELPPSPYLVIDGIDEKTIRALPTAFQVKVFLQDTHFIVESAVTECFKRQGLRLWYTARHLLAQYPALRLQLSERAILRDVIEANINQTLLTHPDTLRTKSVPISLQEAGSFSISPLNQLILMQVGYPLQATEQNLILQYGDPLFKHFVKHIQATAAAV